MVYRRYIMAAKKSKDQPAKSPEKRLTKQEMRKELISKAREKPHILSAEEYGEWLDHTVLARVERGEKALGEVRRALGEAALDRDDSEAKDLRLAIEEIDRAIIAFQYAPLGFNIMYRPAIDGRPVMNAILWETRQKER